MVIKERKRCPSRLPQIRTPHEFEKYVNCFEVPRDFPGKKIIEKTPTAVNGLAFPDGIVKLGGIFDREAIFDSKFKKVLTKKDVDKIVRDAKGRDRRFLFPPSGLLRGVDDKILYANKDIKIPPSVEDFAKQERVTIQRTCKSKYKRKIS